MDLNQVWKDRDPLYYNTKGDFNIMEKLLTKSDLATRWGVSRQFVNYRSNTEGFPKPIQLVSNGKIAVYAESEIKLYEEKKGMKVV